MKRHVIVICFLAVCFWPTPGVNGAELRTWTSKSGKFTIKAELLSFDQEVMILRRDNGKTLKVPLAKLSKEDQEYVLDQPKPQAEPVAAREEKSVAALEKLGAKIVEHPRGGIRVVNLSGTDITDANIAKKARCPKCNAIARIVANPPSDHLLLYLSSKLGVRYGI